MTSDETTENCDPAAAATDWWDELERFVTQDFAVVRDAVLPPLPDFDDAAAVEAWRRELAELGTLLTAVSGRCQALRVKFERQRADSGDAEVAARRGSKTSQ